MTARTKLIDGTRFDAAACRLAKSRVVPETAMAQSSVRHRWADPVRPDVHATYRACTRCGMCKTSRHEGIEHWLEYFTADGSRVVMSDGSTPPCETGETS